MANWSDKDEDWRALRGGSWFNQSVTLPCVARGGSWYYPSDLLRCAARLLGVPRGDWNYYGFRVVCLFAPGHT